jgi:3-hydroxyisobutyrate dehydrogenase-like beta-hydroxyacid dehydrogenase
MTQSDLFQVGYIGLGNMGAPMAKTLLQAGFDLTVFDVRPSSMEPLVAAGARAATSVAELTQRVDVICTCVLYDEQVRHIFLDDDGVIAHARPGLIALIHSTVHPQTAVEIAAAGTKQNVSVIDAAVSGGSARSKSGSLTLMVGGEPRAIERAMPVLDAIGDRKFFVGSAGMGQVVKLGNNVMALANALVAMEALRLVDSFGVDRASFFEVVQSSSGASASIDDWDALDRYGVEHTLAGTDELPHRLAKDLKYAVSVAQDRWVVLPIVALCSQLLPAMMETRWWENGLPNDEHE